MKSAIAVCSLVSVFCVALGDEIVLKDGTKLTGKIIASTDQQYGIKTIEGKLVMVKKDSVETVTESKDAELGSRKNAASSSASGKLDQPVTSNADIPVREPHDAAPTHLLVFKSGAELQGRLILQSEELVVVLDQNGKKQQIAGDKIERIVDLRKLLNDEYPQRAARVEKNDAEGNYDLALWCVEKRLRGKAIQHLRAALAGWAELGREYTSAAEKRRTIVGHLEKLQDWEPVYEYYSGLLAGQPDDEVSKVKLAAITLVYCPTCHKQGKVQCHDCLGKGRVTCSCGGRKQDNRSQCPLCKGDGRGVGVYGGLPGQTGEPRIVATACQKCWGQGWVILPCSKCQGTGMVRCATCCGAGQLPCPKCSRKVPSTGDVMRGEENTKAG